MSENTAQSMSAAGAADVEVAEDCREYLSRSPSLLPVQLVEAEKKSLSRSDFPALLVEGRRFDAISVRGWEQPHIQLTVCKVAAAGSKERAAEVLRQITVETGGGKISSRGPAIGSSVFIQNAKIIGRENLKPASGDETFWFVHYVLHVPHDLEVSLSAENGDISLSDLGGNVRARTENGGIVLNAVGGKVEARTDNGGIKLSGGRGEVSLRTDNGGINIELTEEGWRDGSLDARAGNGGLTVQVPPLFASAIEAETSSRAPLRCELQGCGPVQRNGERQRIRIGSAAPAVRVSTENGELHIVPSR